MAGTILDRFPEEGGLFITDGSNLWGKQLKRLTRPSGVPIHVWRPRPAQDQPLESHALCIITATRES